MKNRFYILLSFVSLQFLPATLHAEDVVAHFRQAIATNTVPDAQPFDRRVRLSRLDAERERLWQQWCWAATEAMTQQLFPMDSLAYKKGSILFLFFMGKFTFCISSFQNNACVFSFVVFFIIINH